VKVKTLSQGLLFLLTFLLLSFCQNKNPISVSYDEVFNVKLLKWYGGHQAAVSLTYDAAWGADPRLQDAVDEVLNRNLRMDFEVVTGIYDRPENEYLIQQMREVLMPMLAVLIRLIGHSKNVLTSCNIGDCAPGRMHIQAVREDRRLPNWRINLPVLFVREVLSIPRKSFTCVQTMKLSRQIGTIYLQYPWHLNMKITSKLMKRWRQF